MRYLTFIRLKGGAHPLFRVDIFWIWVAGDTRLYYYPGSNKSYWKPKRAFPC